MSKGITYVAVDPGIAEDPTTLEVAEAFGLDPFALAGRCVRFFGRVAEHRPDGNLEGLGGAVLDAWAGGGVAGLGLALRDALTDDTGTLRAWDRYNGSALRQREAARARARARRGTNNPEECANSSRTVREQFAHGTRTVRDNHTIPDINNHDNDNARESAAAFLTAGGEAAMAYLPALTAAFRASTSPDTLAQELGALVSGMHGPGGRPVPPAVVGRAVHEMQVAGARLTPRALRRFCEDLLRPDDPGRHPAPAGSPGEGTPRRRTAPAATAAPVVPLPRLA